MSSLIYLDHHATTPADPRVLSVMHEALENYYGNPSSNTHALGWKAKEVVSEARKSVAQLVQCTPREIVFTSGATESNNLALKGFARANKDKGKHIITTRIEHKAVLDACTRLSQEGFEISLLEPDEQGRIGVETLKAALRDDTILVSVMLANNEIGTVQDIDALSRAAKKRGAAFHTDAVQGIGRVPYSLEHIDMLSLSAHKIYGPKGVGALYVRRKPKTRLEPLLDGGGHEWGMRSGTLNVPGIVGFGKACELMLLEGADESARQRDLRDQLEAGLIDEIDGTFVNAAEAKRLSHNLSVGFLGVAAEDVILASQHRLAMSSGSACTTHTLEPSHVLRAIGIGHERAHATLRLGLGRTTSEPDVLETVALLAKVVAEIRGRL